MLTIEEYIARRKKEDHLNEFDVDARIDNMRACTNYVFEYFSSYLDTTEAEERTALHDEKLEKLRKILQDYDPETREWLIGIYADHGKRVDLSVANVLKQDEFFWLYHSDSEFRSLSYDCYSQIIRKNPFLKGQTEMLFRSIREYHQVQSERRRKWGVPFVSDQINDWIEDTWARFGVDVARFAYEWVDYFWNNESLWPTTHRLKSTQSFRKHDYNIRQKSNLFNLDSLYRKMPKKSFTRGRKQEFEILMMYYWLHQIEGDDEGYWQEYCEKTLPALSEGR